MIKELYEKICFMVQEKINSYKYIYDVIEDKETKKCYIMRSRGLKKEFYDFYYGVWKKFYKPEDGKCKDECVCAIEYFMTKKIKNRFKRNDAIWSSDE